jgi:hypothetical protein
LFEDLIRKGFQIEFHGHAKAILSVDFPEAVCELASVLEHVTIPIQEIIGSGGGETKGTQRLRKALAGAHWNKVNFLVEKKINGITREAKSHEVDHVREFPNNNMLALEIEWNNKDPFSIETWRISNAFMLKAPSVSELLLPAVFRCRMSYLRLHVVMRQKRL